MAGTQENLYAIIGVGRNASQDEIKRAYLKLARELHPDAHPGDNATEERFKKVNNAYEVLSDPLRRRQYDTIGSAATRAGADPYAGFTTGGLGDLFETLFGGAAGFNQTVYPRGGGLLNGEDAETYLDLDFVDAVFGTERQVSLRLLLTCTNCGGSGARPGTEVMACPTCGGAGQVQRVRQSMFGQVITSGICSRCGGAGIEIPTPCGECRGEGRRRDNVNVPIPVPAGVDNGATLRMPGRGAGGARGGQPGDLFVNIRVKPHPTMTRQGTDLHSELHVTVTQAALGAQVSVPTLEGEEVVAVPRGTQAGKDIRLRGHGVPHLQGRGRGDLLLTVAVDTPTDLTKSQEELLRALALERGEAVADADAGVMSRIRGAFK
ncbi:MAG: molecular chaperone DnaJ [Acidimicrobiales bacterium]